MGLMTEELKRIHVTCIDVTSEIDLLLKLTYKNTHIVNSITDIRQKYFSIMHHWLNLRAKTEVDLSHFWHLELKKPNSEFRIDRIFLRMNRMIRPIYFGEFIKKLLYYKKFCPKKEQLEGIFDIANYTIEKEQNFLQELNKFYYEYIKEHKLNINRDIPSHSQCIFKDRGDYTWRLRYFRDWHCPSKNSLIIDKNKELVIPQNPEKFEEFCELARLTQ